MPEASDVVWSASLLPRSERFALLRQRGCTIWLTGLSGAGKSSIARALEVELVRAGRFTCVLDGDNLRHGLNHDLGFTAADRHENVRRVAHVARLVAEAGGVALVALIAPYAADRAAARTIAGDLAFLEVHVHAELAVCAARDPKGLYRRARDGSLVGLTGIDAPYEVPLQPDLRLDTGCTTLAEATGTILAALRERGLTGAGPEP